MLNGNLTNHIIKEFQVSDIKAGTVVFTTAMDLLVYGIFVPSYGPNFENNNSTLTMRSYDAHGESKKNCTLKVLSAPSLFAPPAALFKAVHFFDDSVAILWREYNRDGNGGAVHKLQVVDVKTCSAQPEISLGTTTTSSYQDPSILPFSSQKIIEIISVNATLFNCKANFCKKTLDSKGALLNNITDFSSAVPASVWGGWNINPISNSQDDGYLFVGLSEYKPKEHTQVYNINAVILDKNGYKKIEKELTNTTDKYTASSSEVRAFKESVSASYEKLVAYTTSGNEVRAFKASVSVAHGKDSFWACASEDDSGKKAQIECVQSDYSLNLLVSSTILYVYPTGGRSQGNYVLHATDDDGAIMLFGSCKTAQCYLQTAYIQQIESKTGNYTLPSNFTADASAGVSHIQLEHFGEGVYCANYYVDNWSSAHCNTRCIDLNNAYTPESSNGNVIQADASFIDMYALATVVALFIYG